MWSSGRIALLLGIVVGGAVATWQIVDVRTDAVEVVSTAESPLPVANVDEPPLERLDASVIAALQSALPDAIRANADIPASSSGVRLESDTARFLAESAALAEVTDLGPVYGPDDEILGHSFGVPVPTGVTIRFTRPSPFTDEFLEIAPSLSGDRQMEVLGVATMVVAVAVDGTILFVEHHPVGADGGLVTANDLSPPDQQPVLVTDANGEPVFTDNGDVLVRIGDVVVEMAPGNPEG